VIHVVGKVRSIDLFQVLEKSLFKREVGFMISIGPTGLSVLTSFGEDCNDGWSEDSAS
jgi:hypothetical protein